MIDRVAVLGTGRMGAAMARRLAEQGFDLVLHNRTASKAERLAEQLGASVAATPREAAAAAPVVLSSLADDPAVLEVHLGDEGTAAGLGDGAVLLETSTIDPETVLGLRGPVAERGAHLLDAPVSGSVPLVEKGQLMVMVGGEPDPLEQARPVLEALASRVLHVGELGAGATMKLAVNALVHAVNVAIAEALVLAERSGVERSRAYEVIASSAISSPFVQYKRPAFEDPEGSPVAFSLDLVAKDLDLILGLADKVGAPMEQGRVNRRLTREAVEAGLGERDMSVIAELLREAAGGEGRRPG